MDAPAARLSATASASAGKQMAAGAAGASENDPRHARPLTPALGLDRVARVDRGAAPAAAPAGAG